ncbi:MAG TPA: very short patch repair endonuclease [Pyrinomonadaceae bacterium]|jgi:DNA mismatch endonuclease (patch repair protein)
MADNLTPEQRKRNMTAIKSRHTKPEIIVRSILHRLGYRFRLHDAKLPGKPDIVLSRHKKIVLVHGCFWHMHDCKRGSVTPKTNADYWQPKRYRNVERDKTNLAAYTDAGYETLTIWECEVKNTEAVAEKLKNFLASD